MPFPRRVHEELVASGPASLHHLLPETGWVTYYIEDAADASAASSSYSGTTTTG